MVIFFGTRKKYTNAEKNKTKSQADFNLRKKISKNFYNKERKLSFIEMNPEKLEKYKNLYKALTDKNIQNTNNEKLLEAMNTVNAEKKRIRNLRKRSVNYQLTTLRNAGNKNENATFNPLRNKYTANQRKAIHNNYTQKYKYWHNLGREILKSENAFYKKANNIRKAREASTRAPAAAAIGAPMPL